MASSSNGGRAGASHTPSFLDCESSSVEGKSHGGLFLPRSIPYIRRGSSGRRGPWKPFSLPPDVELEEAEAETDAQGVEENGRAGLMAGIDGADEEDVIQQREVVASDNSIWRKFPRRYKLMVTTSLAFVICNMDKVSGHLHCIK